MLSVSSGFKNAIKQLDVMSDGKVDIFDGVTTLNLTSDDISKIEIYGSAFNNDKVLGNLAQHSLTLELLGDKTKLITLGTEKTARVWIGVKVGASYEYVQFQDFIITEVKYNDTTRITKVLGTDSLIKLNKEWVDSNVYPITLKTYLESVLSHCGLSLENTSFSNSGFSITSQPISNYVSCKEVVERVAELALSFVTINKVSGKVELKKAFDPFYRGYTHNELNGFTYGELEPYTYEQISLKTYGELLGFTHAQLASMTHYDLMYAIPLNDELITKSNYWTFKTEDYLFGKYGYNTLTLKISQVEGENNSKSDSGLIASDGVVELSIVDNPFINTEALRLSVIDTMFDEIWGYKYYPYTLEYRGFPYLELGDITQIINYDGGEFNSPIYEMTLRYDGGIYGKLNAKALSLTETKYRNPVTLREQVKGVEVKVDKVNGEFNILAGKYNNGLLEGTYYNFDGDAFTIKNALNAVVFSADSLGNLTLVGDIRGVKDGILRVELSEEFLKFYDASGGIAVSSYADSNNFYTTTKGSTSETQWSSLSLYDDSNIVSSSIASSNDVYTTSMGCDVDDFFAYSRSYMSAYENLDFISSFIDVKSNGQITLSSKNGAYKILFGGVYKTITVDGSGFLKAV